MGVERAVGGRGIPGLPGQSQRHKPIIDISDLVDVEDGGEHSQLRMSVHPTCATVQAAVLEN